MRRFIVSLVVLLVAPRNGEGFVIRSSVRQGNSFARPTVGIKYAGSHLTMQANDSESSSRKTVVSPSTATGVLATVLATLTTSPLASFAAGPDWGIFEGRTGSLLHPVAMASLLLYSLYTGYLGLQWKRQRTIGDEIKAVQSELKSVQAAFAKEQGEDEPEGTSPLAAPLESQIAELQAERKELSQKNPRDQHFSQGALLAFLGTAFAIEGPLNTYARAGKLFPGPHLYAGAGLVVLWALAAACVPAMQKGSDTARTVHIGANVAGIAMFVWQVTSGIPILLKVIELTKWP